MTLNDEPLIGLFFTKKSHLFGDQGQTLWRCFDSNFIVCLTIKCCKSRNHMKPFFFCSVNRHLTYCFLNHCFHFSYSYFKINDAQPWQHFIFISSPEPKARRWAYNIARHLLSVRLSLSSVTIFNGHLLWSHEADSCHISHIASISRGNK